MPASPWQWYVGGTRVKDGGANMMVSTKGRYALRLMIDIAKQGEVGSLVTMRQAAEREGLSVKYLEQLGGALVKADVLKSVRGVSGGYLLARPADEITVGDILRATEGSSAPVACVEDSEHCERRLFGAGILDRAGSRNRVVRRQREAVDFGEAPVKSTDPLEAAPLVEPCRNRSRPDVPRGSQGNKACRKQQDSA